MSIINDALKKVQANLDKKDAAAAPASEQKLPAAAPELSADGPPPAAPPKKTLATIEQEEKDSKQKIPRPDTAATPSRPAPSSLFSSKLFKISSFILLFVCFSIFMLFSLLTFLKNLSLKKPPSFSTQTKESTTAAASSEKKSSSLSSVVSPRSNSSTAPAGALSPVSHAALPVETASSAPLARIETPPRVSSSPPASSPTPIIPSPSSINYFQKIFSPALAESSPAKKDSPGSLVLKGIVTKGNHQVALINNGIYEEGTAIDDAKVISISTKEVKLLRGDQTIILTIERSGF